MPTLGRETVERGRHLVDRTIRELESRHELPDPQLAARLATITSNLAWCLRDSLVCYGQRTKVHPGTRNEDPGTYEAMADRFAPFWACPLESDDDLLVAAELLLTIMVDVRSDADAILVAAVKAEAG